MLVPQMLTESHKMRMQSARNFLGQFCTRRFFKHIVTKDKTQILYTNFFEEEIETLVPCYKKCVHNGDDYVEKYVNIQRNIEI